MTSIVLADGLNVVREGIRALLQSQPDLTVVGEAASGREALKLVQEHHPDLIITDLFIPGLDGLEIVRRVTEEYPETRAIVLSAHTEERHVLNALRLGALGYVSKSSTSRDLFKAIHEVSQGRRFLLPPLSRRVINGFLNKAKQAPPDPFDTLTSREREVLYHAIAGLTNAEIGKQLSVSVTTVATHRAHLLKKLGLHSQTELLHLAARRGILPPDD
jgi:two-component system response regulator NreC